MESCDSKRISVSSDDGVDDEEEKLDPRIQTELERLNRASAEINQLEVSLDDARSNFRATLAESTQRLDAMSKKLGSCVEKARPYYQARMNAKLIQGETQKAALRFERACSMQAAAKEMVNVAEQGFLNKGQMFDTAWQEMLNHATSKVNEAEIEIMESEMEHQKMAYIYDESEQKVKKLQREFKRSIGKSRPYFELKSKFNQIMEEQKERVGKLGGEVKKQKCVYSRTLKNLEYISDQIHAERERRNQRKTLGRRGSGVGAETPAPPPSQTDELRTETDGCAGRDRSVSETEHEKSAFSYEVQPVPASCDSSQPMQASCDSSQPVQASCDSSQPVQASCDSSQSTLKSTKMNKPMDTISVSSPSTAKRKREPLNPSSFVLNVGALQDLQEFPGLPYTQLPKTKSKVDVLPARAPTAKEDDFSDTESMKKVKNDACMLGARPMSEEGDISDNESVGSSAHSTHLPDDDVIEHAMNDVTDIPDYVANSPDEKAKYMTLPAKLSYLEYYMKYQCNMDDADKIDEENHAKKATSDSD